MTVDETIHIAVLQLARRRNGGLERIDAAQPLIDELGLDSLDLAQLVAMLEDDLGVDPFATAAIATIRTVGDLCEAYRRALAARP